MRTTTTTSLIDDLSALLDTMDADDPSPGTGTATVLAAAPTPRPAHPIAVATPPPTPGGAIVPIADARARRERREALADEAMETSVAIMRVIRTTFEEHGADFDDAVKALGPVHRVMEHADKMAAAREQPQVTTAPLIFNIILDDTPQEPVRKRAAMPMVVDIGPTTKD
jgi:hypothetical protein